MKLEELKGNWVDELPSVLWSYRTTLRDCTNQTPYALAFSSKAIILVEIGLPLEQTERQFDEKQNSEALCLNLDLLEEQRNFLQLRNAEYLNRMKKYYNARVKHRCFKSGDLVLKKVLQKTGALEPNWIGSYKVKEVVPTGTYQLVDLNEK